MGLLEFLSKPKLNMCKGRSKKVLRIYVACGFTFGRTLPYFSGAKKRKFYKGTNQHFLICHVNSQKPANDDWGNYWGYMSHRRFSLTHVLILGKIHRLYRGGGQKTAILGEIFGKVLNWWLPVPQREYGKSKNNNVSHLLSDYTDSKLVRFGW